MTDNIVDFRSQKDGRQHKRKEAKVDAIRKAFRLARGESQSAKVFGIGKKGNKPHKK